MGEDLRSPLRDILTVQADIAAAVAGCASGAQPTLKGQLRGHWGYIRNVFAERGG